jgi:negative regulator of flagellin synthesis FlgM
MSNPIDRVLNSGVQRLQERGGAVSRKGPEAGNGSEASPSGSALLDLTGRARELKALEKELASSPEFDAGRVNELRQALSEGSYKVDARRIADKLLALESDLP